MFSEVATLVWLAGRQSGGGVYCGGRCAGHTRWQFLQINTVRLFLLLLSATATTTTTACIILSGSSLI